MMIRGVTINITLSVSRPTPLFLNSRLTYGILFRIDLDIDLGFHRRRAVRRQYGNQDRSQLSVGSALVIDGVRPLR